MSLTYIFSQIVTVLMYAFLSVTYFSKNKKAIVAFNCLAIVANAVAFILLGAWTGLAMCIIDLLRNFYIMWDEKKHGKSKQITKRDIVFLLIVYATMAIATIPTYEGFFSLFSVFASATYTFSIWQKSTRVYKFCGIPVGILWITYNAFIGSFFGVVLESALLVVSAIGFVLDVKGNRLKKPLGKKK